MAAPATLVFGGRGFVGATICKEVARRGLGPVLSLARSSGATAGDAAGIQQVSGVDALRPETFATLLAGCRAVVISIGEPPWVLDKERAMRANGLTNISILKAAAEHKVPKIVLINATMPKWSLIAGYREGKEAAEATALQYPSLSETDAGVLILKPSAISGTRYEGKVPIPLWLMLEPMRAVMRLFSYPCQALEYCLPSLFSGVLRPPVRVEELALAAADAIEDPSFRGVKILGTDELVGYVSSQGKKVE